MSNDRSVELEAERMCQALRRAVDVLGTSRNAIGWLSDELPLLGDRKPALVAAESPEGLELVLQILGRIEHGVFS